MGLTSTRPADRPGERHGRYFGLAGALGEADDVRRDSGKGSTHALIANQWDALAREINTYKKLKNAQLYQYIAEVMAISTLCGMLLSWEDDLGRQRAAIIRGAKDFADFKLQYYNDLKRYEDPQVVHHVKDLVANHFKTLHGKFLVNMANHKHIEYIDPLHRSGTDVLDAWSHHVQVETKAGRDPNDSIIRFLLSQENVSGQYARVYATVEQRVYYRLLYKTENHVGAGDGGATLLCAMYHYNMGHRGPRYAAHLDGGDPEGGRFKCRWLPYTSQEYVSVRGNSLHDMVGGDIYVMDEDGYFYSFQPSEFHSYMLGGERVQAAGVVVVNNGKVRGIDNKSGHYQPTWKNLHQAVVDLDSHKVFVPDAVVGLMLPGENIMYFAKDDYLQVGRRGFPYDATRDLVDRYHRKYRGGLPVPPTQIDIISDTERTWPTATRYSGDMGQTKFDRWREFMRAAFPKTVNALLQGMEKLAKASNVPALAQWQKESDAGLLARRDEITAFVDGALERYHQAVKQEYERYLPDLTDLDAALRHLEVAVRAWLQYREDKEKSTRRPNVQHLGTRVEADRKVLDSLRRLPPETMPLKGIQM
jgi:hypothetical protein